MDAAFTCSYDTNLPPGTTLADIADHFGGDPDDRPVHRPYAPEAPIPGHHHYDCCDPDRPRVNTDGRCESCGEQACPHCGFGEPCICEEDNPGRNR